jgi:hypothetical protein
LTDSVSFLFPSPSLEAKQKKKSKRSNSPSIAREAEEEGRNKHLNGMLLVPLLPSPFSHLLSFVAYDKVTNEVDD